MNDYIKRENAMNLANNSILRSIDANDIARIPAADVRENEYCEFEKSGYLDELCCSHCFNTIGTIADTQRMRFCPYCGRTRIRRQIDD